MRNITIAILLAASACAARPPVSSTVKTAALVHYARGESLDDIAERFSLRDRAAARDAIHDALQATWQRYYRER